MRVTHESRVKRLRADCHHWRSAAAKLLDLSEGLKAQNTRLLGRNAALFRALKDITEHAETNGSAPQAMIDTGHALLDAEWAKYEREVRPQAIRDEDRHRDPGPRQCAKPAEPAGVVAGP